VVMLSRFCGGVSDFPMIPDFSDTLYIEEFPFSILPVSMFCFQQLPRHAVFIATSKISDLSRRS
jgi:hypothetical protein